MINREQKELLTEEVRNYISNNIYQGYSQPFELECLRESSLEDVEGNRNLVAVLKGIPEEDIFEIDYGWQKGLMEVGNKFGVKLRLPYYLFAK
jgi:hypothetical protein